MISETVKGALYEPVSGEAAIVLLAAKVVFGVSRRARLIAILNSVPLIVLSVFIDVKC